MPPSCPECDSPMVLRTARRGRRAGSRFWGCSKFPGCRGTRDVDSPSASQEAQAPRNAPTAASTKDLLFVEPSVPWVDYVSPSWDRIYTAGGGSLRSIDLNNRVDLGYAQRRIEQTFLAVHPPAASGNPTPDRVRQVSGTVRKILQRGDAPPPDPDAEHALLRECGIMGLSDPILPGDLSVVVDDLTQLPDPDDLLAAAYWSASDFELDRSAVDVFGSDEEADFFELVRSRLGAQAARWLHPQASLDGLVEGMGGSSTGHRRVDYLFAPPWSAPLIIEIDGKQHDTSKAVDAERDDLLARAGIEVVRIPASQVRSGRLDDILRRLSPPTIPDPTSAALRLFYGPAMITQFGLALAEALDRGWLEEAGDWIIHVDDPIGAVEVGAPSILELLAAVDELWAGDIAPASVMIRVSATGRVLRFQREGPTSYAVADAREHDPAALDLDVRFELDRGPFDALSAPLDTPTIVFRSSTLPVRCGAYRTEGPRRGMTQDPAVLPDILRRVLRFVFAKKDFREGQEEAVRHILKGGDAVVLLPTGAGKSLIYQLAGLLLPGRTLIIDPIVALIEDQVAVLRTYGIDRAVGLSSAVTRAGLSERALDLVRRGDALFFFVAPERLQQQAFRDALASLTVSTPINLAVIDEAHCVSEWGHDFRPAYLGLGSTIQKHSRGDDGSSPPLLALTGTASRAVLRDVLIELDLDRSDRNLIVRPKSFNRPELSFDVVSAEPGTKHVRLVGYLQDLPGRLGMDRARLFQTRGPRANLGVVFAPHVNGPFGITKVATTIEQSRLVSEVGLYAGKAPKGIADNEWARQKRETAARFRAGDIVVLATTKAFGMGIDIPNIRYTIHFGLPGSIESFYQEAGRAGRDRLASRCAVIFTEDDPNRTRTLLAEDVDTESARKLQEAAGRLDDDIIRQLFFHFTSFPGVEEETAELHTLLDLVATSSESRELKIPFGRREKSRERAIYRLQQVGFVSGYLKEWGSRTFVVRLTERTARDLDAAFLDLVQRVQPGQRESWEQRLSELSSHDDPIDRARRLGGLLVELIYRTIERSRRRALRELAGMIRDSSGDTDIRQRIEDYFREGDIVPVLQSFLEREQVDATEWATALASLPDDAAGELRGAAVRFLESYPDHPALLLSRAYAELLSHGDIYEFEENLGRLWEIAPDRYAVPDADLVALARWLLDRTSALHPAWAPLLWLAGPLRRDPHPELELEVLQADNRGGESVIVLNRRLARIVTSIDDFAGSKT